MIKRIIALMLVVVLLLSGNVFAADTYGGYNVPVDIDVNGSFIKCTEKPIMIDGMTYIPLRAFSDAIGGVIEWNENEMTATLNKDGHSVVFFPEKKYCLVNGVEKDYMSVFYNDLTFVPVRALTEALGYDVEWDDFYLTVKITAPGIIISDVYKDNSYTYEDILYLGKITQIESGYQYFDVKLGVAATVMNRVKSSKFPNTVKEVIFDTKYGVQFPPVHTDKINSVPSGDSIVAAKCALNGVNPVRNSLYFIDIRNAASSWAHKNRPHYTTIYDMFFYE